MAANNWATVVGLHDATQILTLTDAQRDLANDMLANAEKLSDGTGGDAALLRAQVRDVLDLWTDTDSSAPAPSADELLERFKAGLDGKSYITDNAQEAISDPAVAELLERFKAGMDGRKYTFESFEGYPIKRLRVMYGAGERSNEI